MKRVILVNTPSYYNEKYLDAKYKFQYNFDDFDKRFVVFKSNRNKNLSFSVALIGFDGKLKKIYRNFSKNQILNDIDKMPMGFVRKT